MTAENENLLARWSRRKRQSTELNAQEDELLAPDISIDDDLLHNADPAAHQAVQIEQQALLTDDDMPDLEELDEDSDFSLFMSSGVSDKLRNLALRKMFSAPVFNIRDGLDEYDEDYTTFEALGDVVTSDMKHQIELEAEKQLQLQMNADNEPADEDGEQPADLDDESSEDITETDITETDITEELSTQGVMQPLSTTSIHPGSVKNPAKISAQNRPDNE